MFHNIFGDTQLLSAVFREIITAKFRHVFCDNIINTIFLQKPLLTCRKDRQLFRIRTGITQALFYKSTVYSDSITICRILKKRGFKMLGLEIFNKLFDFNDKKEEGTLILFFDEGILDMKEKVKNLTDHINLNTRIAVGVKRADYTGTYDSRVEDVTNSKILISHPTDNGVPIPMLPGTKLVIEYVSNNGRYKFETSVLGRHKEGSLSFIEVAVPEEITRDQLREFFRVPTNLKAKVKIFYSKVPDKTMKIPHKKVDCKVVDMSGGGGKLITDVFFDKGQIFGLDLSDEIEGADNVMCTCIRAKRIQEKSEVSFKFNIEKESERNLIIKYVFKRQIELKQIFG